MRVESFDIEFAPIGGPPGAWRAKVDASQWRSLCQHLRNQRARLLALWGSDGTDVGAGLTVHAAVLTGAGALWLSLPLEHDSYPPIDDIFPSATRMQWAVFDMLGIRAIDAPSRPWLRHGAWPADQFPLRKNFDASFAFPREPDSYPFTAVEGDGVHEIPVGPVHAGVIEPGHFRFSVVGERLLRLEERLGYTHKGIEKRFEQMTLEQGRKLAGRISGDSTVAYAWAYAMAVEGALRVSPPHRAIWLRALLLERERIANHLGDLGALGNDAGFSFGLAQFLRLKEGLVRSNGTLFGHRYLMDVIVPGGVRSDLGRPGVGRLQTELVELAQQVAVLHAIYDDHTGLQDRFMGAGRVAPEFADRLGLVGLAGRASGQAWDARVNFPAPPYDSLEVKMAASGHGDVAARVAVRFDELVESIRLCRRILERMPEGTVCAELPEETQGGIGLGLVEGWRGEVFIALEAGAGNRIRRLHPHDPSWQNWPVLEHAVMGNIVPDFPLINKSFNLSYSGHDL